MNPWNLPPREAQVMQCLVAVCSEKVVAAELGISPKTVQELVARAKQRIGARTRLAAVLEWDRWARREERGQPMSLGIYDSRCQGRIVRAAGGGHLANECTDCLRRTQVPADVKSVPWYPKPPAIPLWWNVCPSYVGPRADEVAGD